MIEFQLFKAIMPAMREPGGAILEERYYKVRINLAQVLDYSDATGDETIQYDGNITAVNYNNGYCRFVMVDFETFHGFMMKFKASQTRYMIQTKFN